MNNNTRRWTWAMVGVAIGCIVAFTLTSLTFTSTTVDELRQTQDGNDRVLSTLLDCTKPGGECYERGLRRTGRAVQDINVVVQLAAICAKRPGVVTYRDIKACVKEGLK